MKKILITGVAGFIGSFLAKRILQTKKDYEIIGIDNMNDYYDVTLKSNRISMLNSNENFKFIKGDISDKEFVEQLFFDNDFEIVVNLAAQAGVRYSITNPDAYIRSNIIGFFNIIEGTRYLQKKDKTDFKHFVFASSSSVYGMNQKIPYSTKDKVDKPVSLYAATKKSNELIAHAYSKLYDIPCTGLRFFTVYGPFGRPDMAYFSFTKKILNNDTIKIFNNGDMFRDFTYIDDIINGLMNVLWHYPLPNDDGVKYKIYNIGNNKPVSLMDFIDVLEKSLKKEGITFGPIKKEYLPMQPGDVYQTYADIDDMINDFSFKPQTSLEIGLSRFAKWYKEYYLCKNFNK